MNWHPSRGDVLFLALWIIGLLTILVAFEAAVVAPSFLFYMTIALCTVAVAAAGTAWESGAKVALATGLIFFLGLIPRIIMEFFALRRHDVAEVAVLLMLQGAAAGSFLLWHAMARRLRVGALRVMVRAGICLVAGLIAFPVTPIALNEPIALAAGARTGIGVGLVLTTSSGGDELAVASVGYPGYGYPAQLAIVRADGLRHLRTISLPGRTVGIRDHEGKVESVVAAGEATDHQSSILLCASANGQCSEIVSTSESSVPSALTNCVSNNGRWTAMNGGMFIDLTDGSVERMGQSDLDTAFFLHWTRQDEAAFANPASQTLFLIQPETQRIASYRIPSLVGGMLGMAVSPSARKAAAFLADGRTVVIQELISGNVRTVVLSRSFWPRRADPSVVWLNENELVYVAAQTVAGLNISTGGMNFLSPIIDLPGNVAYHEASGRLFWTSCLGQTRLKFVETGGSH